MLLLLLWGMFSMLPLGSAVISCRVACRRCRENAAYPEMLEVYCAMCEECKGRRREWLAGQKNLRMQNGNHLRNNDLDLTDYQEDCSTTPNEELCEEPVLLANKITTTTTTTSTTTSTTTHRPCTPKPHCVKTTRSPCYTMPCPVVPLAMPVCQMCPSLGSVPTIPPSIVPLLSADKKAENPSTGTSESMYFYVGVPKNLLKDLKLLRS